MIHPYFFLCSAGLCAPFPELYIGTTARAPLPVAAVVRNYLFLCDVSLYHGLFSNTMILGTIFPYNFYKNHVYFIHNSNLFTNQAFSDRVSRQYAERNVTAY